MAEATRWASYGAGRRVGRARCKGISVSYLKYGTRGPLIDELLIRNTMANYGAERGRRASLRAEEAAGLADAQPHARRGPVRGAP